MVEFLGLLIFITTMILLLGTIIALLKGIKKALKIRKEIEIEEEHYKVDTQVYLTKAEIDVLDLYDKSNIRIPTEIIEDLHHMNLKSDKDILNFIETQRNYWKLENTKKLFRREVK